MNEIVKRRLLGLLVLLASLLIFSLIVPAPGDITPSDVPRHRLVVDLASSQPIQLPVEFPTSAPTTLEAPAILSGETGTVESPPDIAEMTPLTNREGTPATTSLDAPTSAVVATSPGATAKAAPTLPPTSSMSAAAKDLWYVQIGVFSNASNAQQLVQTLKRLGYTPLVSMQKTDKGTLHRVRVGPYNSREGAVVEQKRLNANGYPQTRLVQ